MVCVICDLDVISRWILCFKKCCSLFCIDRFCGLFVVMVRILLESFNGIILYSCVIVLFIFDNILVGILIFFILMICIFSCLVNVCMSWFFLINFMLMVIFLNSWLGFWFCFLMSMFNCLLVMNFMLIRIWFMWWIVIGGFFIDKNVFLRFGFL